MPTKMLTMSITDFNLYLADRAKSLHKNYTCYLFNCEKDPITNERYKSVLFFSYIEDHVYYKDVISGGFDDDIDLKRKYIQPNTIALTILSNENELSFSFIEKKNLPMFSFNSASRKVEEVKFDPEFIERVLKKCIFDMEMGK